MAVPDSTVVELNVEFCKHGCTSRYKNTKMNTTFLHIISSTTLEHFVFKNDTAICNVIVNNYKITISTSVVFKLLFRCVGLPMIVADVCTKAKIFADHIHTKLIKSTVFLEEAANKKIVKMSKHNELNSTGGGPSAEIH